MKVTIRFDSEPGDPEDMAQLNRCNVDSEDVDRVMVSIANNPVDPDLQVVSLMFHGKAHWSE